MSHARTLILTLNLTLTLNPITNLSGVTPCYSIVILWQVERPSNRSCNHFN